MPDDIQEGDAPVTPPPVITPPAFVQPSLTQEDRQRIVMEELSQRPDEFRSLLGVQNPPADPDVPTFDDFNLGEVYTRTKNDAVAQAVAQIREELQGFSGMVAPVLQDSGAQKVFGLVAVPEPAKPYVQEFMRTLNPQAIQGLNKQSCEFIAQAAMGKAFAEGKLTSQPVSPAEPIGGGSIGRVEFSGGADQNAVEAYVRNMREVGKDDAWIKSSLKAEGFIK